MTSCFVHRREADEKQRAGVVTERDPYRFMSKEAAEEARMLADGMTEWELEEMRANERLPWQVRERRESEGEVKTSSDRNTSSDASDEPETNDEEDEDEDWSHTRRSRRRSSATATSTSRSPSRSTTTDRDIRRFSSRKSPTTKTSRA